MNTLKEIKSGKTGFGLLVENDGYISMTEGRNKELYESARLNEGFDGVFFTGIENYRYFEQQNPLE